MSDDKPPVYVAVGSFVQGELMIYRKRGPGASTLDVTEAEAREIAKLLCGRLKYTPTQAEVDEAMGCRLIKD